MKKLTKTDVDEAEKVTRFGCGALLGVIVGIMLVITFTLSNFGFIVATVVAAVMVSGLLALKYGDEFWYSATSWIKDMFFGGPDQL